MDGEDMHLLALAADGRFQLREVAFLSTSTLHRRVSRLRELGLLEHSGARRNRAFTARRRGLANAARDALHARPSLADELTTPTHLAVLSVFPHPHVDPPAISLVGVSQPTWRGAVEHLRSHNLLLQAGDTFVVNPETAPIRRGPRDVVNPRLPALHWLLDEYRALYLEPPTSVARPRGTGHNDHPGAAGMTHRPIHQRGLETAWRFEDVELGPDAQPVGPTAGLAPFDVIATSVQYAYHGPRTLDTWDHAFLYALAERNPWRPRESPTTTLDDVPQRTRALFAAAASERLLLNVDFIDRANFYGLAPLVDEARAVLRDPGHPMRPEVRRMRDDLGVEEGSLER